MDHFLGVSQFWAGDGGRERLISHTVLLSPFHHHKITSTSHSCHCLSHYAPFPPTISLSPLVPPHPACMYSAPVARSTSQVRPEQARRQGDRQPPPCSGLWYRRTAGGDAAHVPRSHQPHAHPHFGEYCCLVHTMQGRTHRSPCPFVFNNQTCSFKAVAAISAAKPLLKQLRAPSAPCDLTMSLNQTQNTVRTLQVRTWLDDFGVEDVSRLTEKGRFGSPGTATGTAGRGDVGSPSAPGTSGAAPTGEGRLGSCHALLMTHVPNVMRRIHDHITTLV